MNIQALLNNGFLSEAVNVLQDYLKQYPRDIEKRDLFQTLLCISGNLERADQQLELIAELDPETQIFVHTQRQLLRAEKSRHECFYEGRLPEFPCGITESLKFHLDALNTWRNQDNAETPGLLSNAEAARPVIQGKFNNKKFKTFRDIDDLCAGLFEIYLPGGIYAWLALEQIASITTHPPKKLIDLIWQHVSITTHQGKSWEAYMPVVYKTTPLSHEKARLSQMTDWDSTRDIVTGSGQRIFLIDNQDVSQLEISGIIFKDCI